MQRQLNQVKKQRDEFKGERDKLQTKLEDERLFVSVMGEKLPRAIPDNIGELNSTVTVLLKLLQTKVRKQELINTCPVCTENRKDTVFAPCGHRCCHECVE